jgi:antitoxin YefM
MDVVSYSELRQNLKARMDQVCDDHAPLLVTRQNGEPVVMMSLAEYEGLAETLHLLASPVNAERLLNAIKEADAGRLVEHELLE